MSVYFILKMAGDLSLLYAAANAFFCMTSCDVSFLPLLVLSCCGGLGLFLNSKKPILRYLALLPAPLAFFVVRLHLHRCDYSDFGGVSGSHCPPAELCSDLRRPAGLFVPVHQGAGCLPHPHPHLCLGRAAALYPVCHPAV